MCAYNFKVNACKYFQNSVDLNNQNNIFLMALRKVIDFSVCAFLLVIEMSIGNSKDMSIMNFSICLTKNYI